MLRLAEMITTRTGLARLTDWQAIFETWLLRQYGAALPQAGWRVLDIGAGIGDYAVWATRRGASVTAYECDRFCYPALDSNARRYGFSVVHKRVTSLHGLPTADLVKIDIEGGEFALDGWSRYPRIILEYHAPYGDVNALIMQLQQVGFDTRCIPNRRRADLGILSARLTSVPADSGALAVANVTPTGVRQMERVALGER
jgi:hypothetical protein